MVYDHKNNGGFLVYREEAIGFSVTEMETNSNTLHVAHCFEWKARKVRGLTK